MKLFSINNEKYLIPNYFNNDIILIIKKVLSNEENKVLKLIQKYSFPNEHIYIMFVRMYLFRYAIPYIEIKYFSKNNTIIEKTQVLEDLEQKLYLCLYGRAVDDIYDGDSNFFSKNESIILMNEYSQLIKDDNLNEKTHISLINKATEIDENTLLTLSKNDLINRVYYLFDNNQTETDNIYKEYVSSILLYSDFTDIISDVYTNQNTIFSNYLKNNYINDEMKLIVNQKLINFLTKLQKEIKDLYILLMNNNFKNLIYTKKIIEDTIKKM